MVHKSATSLVSCAAILSVVTQRSSSQTTAENRGGALRDDTKNGFCPAAKTSFSLNFR